MTTKEFAEKIQAVIKEYMTFDARDGENYGLPKQDDDENLVVIGKTPDQHFILHIIKIKQPKNEKNHKGNGTKGKQKD